MKPKICLNVYVLEQSFLDEKSIKQKFNRQKNLSNNFSNNL